MPGLTFSIPMGAGADVKELEYIIALHQTSRETRANATVSAHDVRALLKSRYELEITHNQAVQVVRSLGGGDVAFQPPSSPSAKMTSATLKMNKDPQSSSETVITATDNNRMKKITKFFGDVLGDATMFATSKSPRSGENDEKMKSAKTAISGDVLSTPQNGLSKMGEDMKELNRLQKSDQKSAEFFDSKKFRVMQEKVTTSLRGRVINGDHATTSQLQSHIRDEENEQDEEFYDALEWGNGEESSKIVTSWTGRKRDHTKRKMEVHTEYLDLVQVLTTIMIPTFARVAYDSKNITEPTRTRARQYIETSKYFHGMFLRCTSPWARFAAFMRFKLGLDEDEPPPYPSHRILAFGKRALLFRAIPDLAETASHPRLDEDLVQLLLISQGEVERATNKKLVREMVAVAQSSTGLLDDEALLNAISSDLSYWDPTCDTAQATFFQDVFGVSAPQDDTVLTIQEQEALKDEKAITDVENRGTPDPTKIFSRRSKLRGKDGKPSFKIHRGGIDFVLDLQISTVVFVAIWLGFFFTSTVYVAIIFDYLNFALLYNVTSQVVESEFWRVIFVSVINWACLGLILSLVGLIYVLPLSCGNSPSNRKVTVQLLTSLGALVYTLPLYFFAQNSIPVKSFLSDLFRNANLVVGCSIAGILLLQSFLTYLSGIALINRAPLLQTILSAASSIYEFHTHRAAKRKVDKVVSHALQLHEPDSIKGISGVETGEASILDDQIIRNYVAFGERERIVGGILWTWWQILDGSLFHSEGLWLSARIGAIQIAQVILGTLITIVSLLIVEFGADSANSARNEIQNITGVPEWAIDLVPTAEMVQVSFYPAVVVAAVLMAVVIAVFVPSAVSTTLKYRYKVLPSLGSPYFNKYRKSVDATHMNSGNAIYGMLGMAVLTDVVVGGIIFLLVWPPTKLVTRWIAAFCIGIGITVGLKMALMYFCRTNQYRAFYRIRPPSARITSLALECWYLGIAGSVLLARIGQFIFAAVFWVGRIDAFFLSEDVSIFGYSPDSVPTCFFKDLLVHEAHRHPYIERLAQMYLMKLRYGDRFVSDAGSAWRQLLVTSMLPWLTKYRVFSDERAQTATLDKGEEEEMKKEETEKWVQMGRVVMK